MKIKRGFKAVKEEEKRRKKEAERKKGKLWRIFFPKDADEDYEIPVRFLTDEPLCYHEHNMKINGKFESIPCVGDGCEHCEDGDRPRFVGAFLVIDRTEYEVDERDDNGKKTGKKITVSDRVKLLVRGQQDLAVLDRHSKKYGLLDRDWAIYKTGKDTSTKWNFERGDVEEWTEEEIEAILPDKYRDDKYRDEDGFIDFYLIVQEQIEGSDDDEDEEEDTGSNRRSRRSKKEDDEEVESRVRNGVQRLDEDSDKSSKRGRKGSSNSNKKSSKKKLGRKKK